MRRYWVLFFVGVALIGFGIGLDAYYAIVVWPTVTATFGIGCPTYGPCGPPPTPLWARGPFLLGEALVTLGFAFLATSAIPSAKAGPVPRSLRLVPGCMVLAAAVGLLTLVMAFSKPVPYANLEFLVLGGLLAVLGLIWLGSVIWPGRLAPA